jgi:hypothetical protein
MKWARIPRWLMRSTAEVRVPADGDYAGEYEDVAMVISGVLYESGSRLDGTDTVLTDGESGTLFVDAVNSSGAFAIPVGSLVSIDGAPEVSVVAVNEYRIGGEVHHWEIDVR